MKFQLTITMLSDWHVGSGASRRGDIDRLIQRDTDGLPYLPAKTLTGIWRDACELIATGLDRTENETTSAEVVRWSQWVDYLFGEQPAIAESAIETAPQPAALSIRAAHLPAALKQQLNHRSKPAHQALQSAFTFIKPGISIDAKTGCAVEDFLRFEEMARIGTVLTAECELLAPLDIAQQEVAFTLLAAGAKVVERLGGKRRRGAGRCQFQIRWTEGGLIQANSWEVLDRPAPEPPKIPESSENTSEKLLNSFEISIDKARWQRIGITLEALTPIVIPARTIGNVVETLDYIPGTYLLRLVLQQARSLDIELRDAVAQGDLLVTNATIAVSNHPGQPVPASLFYEKLGGGFAKDGDVYNRLCEPEPATQAKGYRKGYIGATVYPETAPLYKTVDTLVGTHNTIQDEVQRPTSDVGGVYSYEAIAPKTVFRAELRMHPSTYAALCQKQPDWWQKLAGHHRIGQSKKDDYGAVDIKVEPIEQEQPQAANSTVTKLTVWLLSDVLLRNDCLRPTASLEDFQNVLLQALKLNDNDSLQIQLQSPDEGMVSAVLRSRRLESWQTRWNLPRPSLVGIAAGSCAVFEVTAGTLDPAKLQQLELSGIGERTVEGYGQICFNHPLLTQPLSTNMQKYRERAVTNKPPQPQSNSESSSLSSLLSSPNPNDDPVFKYAHLIEIAAWREAIRKAALFLASTSTYREELLGIWIQPNEKGEPISQPSMSQLGGLRSVASRLRSPSRENQENPVSKNQEDPVTRWIKSIREKKRDKWDGTNNGLDKINNLVTKQEPIWQSISKALTDLNYPSLQDLTLTSKSVLEQDLWAEAVQLVVDACIRAHKRDLEKEESKHENQSAVVTGANHGA
jgi:CRISPR-associated protein Csx10